MISLRRPKWTTNILTIIVTTLLFLPNTAWGQEPTVTTSFKGLDDDYSIIYDRDQTTGEWTWTTPWPAYWVPSPSESGGLTFYLDYSESQTFDVAYFTSKFALYGTVKKGDLIATITTNDFLQNGFIIVKGGSSNSTLCELNIFNSHAGTYYLYSEKDSETFNGENIRIDLTRIETSYNRDDFVLKSINIYNLQTTPVTPQFSGGNGTADSPYLIGNATDLKDLSECIDNGQLNDKVFQLSADIDCSQLDEFSPIGYKDDNMDYSFKGTFDGNGKTISNLTIEDGEWEYAGLFGYVSGGTIENLTLENIIVNNEGSYAGAIAGVVDQATVKNTLVSGSSSVTSAANAGAIIGRNLDANLENNYYAVSVTTTITGKGSAMGYVHRGIGDSQEDILENDGAMLYNTQIVSMPAVMVDGKAVTAYIENYYTHPEDDVYLVVGGQEVLLQISSSVSADEIIVTNSDTQETIDIMEEDTEDGITTYSFFMPDALVTVDLEIGIEKYDLWIGDTRVTERNCSDILGDGNANQTGTGSFQYVPDLNKLFITNTDANLKVETKDPKGLTVYLAPRSANAVGSIVYTGNGNAPLTITTDGNYPGTISLSANSNVISGFSSLTLEQNIVIIDPDNIAYDGNNKRLGTTSATIGVPLSPITDDEPILPDGNELKPEGGSNDVNKVVDDILYTLGNVNNNEGDGYDDEGCIVINSVTSDQQAARVTQNCIPGTDEYLEGFKGLTFMVPAGNGTIKFDVQTFEGYVMKVMVGDAAPVTVEKTEKGVFEVPYNVAEPTYVYAYNGGKTGDGDNARSIHKGKKTTVHIKIYSISISSKKVKSANPASEASGGSYKGDTSELEGQTILSDEEIEAGKGDVNGDTVVNAADVVEMVNAIAGKKSTTFDKTAADLNGDGVINVADIVIIANKITKK